MTKGPKSLARFFPSRENRSALKAIQGLAQSFFPNRFEKAVNPLFIHGPAGSGKSHLLAGLIQEIIRSRPGLIVGNFLAEDFRAKSQAEGEEGEDTLEEKLKLLEQAQNCDLFILEDLHQLRSSGVELLVQVIDGRLGEGKPMVFTATAGPAQLGMGFSSRLVSRLAGGLVVGLEPLEASSRQMLLEELAQRRQLAVSRNVLGWLAQRLTGGGRQLEGAIQQLEFLSRLHKNSLDEKIVAESFKDQIEINRPTIGKIVRKVSHHFRVDPRVLRSPRRLRNVLWPRQVSMFLARKLTQLSLDQIGSFFGGKDHSTVLHACRKVEQTMQRDSTISGLVRRIHAELA